MMANTRSAAVSQSSSPVRWQFNLTMLMLALMLCWATGQAKAQEPQRYSLEKSDSGIFRLDRVTGDISLCTEQAGKVVCAETDRAEIIKDDQIAILEKRIIALEGRIDQLEKANSASGNVLPTEEEFEKGLSYMERFMRSFFGVAKSLDQAEPASPNRT